MFKTGCGLSQSLVGVKIRSGAKSNGLTHLYWKDNIILLCYNCLVYLYTVYSLLLFYSTINLG